MRIAYFKIKGYKRFLDACVNLDRNLIAFVGPNEAGKTSIFEALRHMEHSTPISTKELTNSLSYDETDEILELAYFVEEEDKKYLKTLNAIGSPNFYFLIKEVNGKIGYKFDEPIGRDLSERKKMFQTISTFKQNSYFEKKLNEIIIQEEVEEEEIDEFSMFDETTLLINNLSSDEENLTSEILAEIEAFANRLKDLLEIASKSKSKKINSISEALLKLIELESAKHPSKTFSTYLYEQRPKFVLFDNQNRTLKETYTLDEIADPPPSLLNLFAVAKLDFAVYHDNRISGYSGKEEIQLEDANKELKNTYSEYWNQDEVYPRIKSESDGIRILIKAVDQYNNISDRSDGLKQFITLLAFALNSTGNRELVLLIDEAEIHLHYDAQADIISLFEKQKIVNSIFYSTHSAGCLPSDLGTGIRAVTQMRSENKVIKHSEIRNSVWRNSAGFSPILLAMGASFLAFSLTRKALIAEGESEPILLPRLFRESASLSYLEFQVAPGLASISPDKCSDLDLEAPKVLYITDGDIGGDAIKEKLRNANIKSKMIFQLNKDHAIEDYVEKETLLKVIQEIISDFHDLHLEIKTKNIPDTGSMNYIKAQCKKINISLPSKVLIAERLVLSNRTNEIIKKSKKTKLKNILNKILAEFK